MKYTYHFNISFRVWIILGDAKMIQNIVKTDFSRPLHVRSQNNYYCEKQQCFWITERNNFIQNFTF